MDQPNLPQIAVFGEQLLTPSTPAALGTLTATPGISNAPAREDHVHAAGIKGNYNYFPNGKLNFGPRGNGPFTTNAIHIDPLLTGGNGSTFIVTREAFALGEIPGVAEAGYYYKNVVTSVAGVPNYVSMYPQIPGLALLAGKVVTLSFYAKADANGKKIATDFVQAFGTGGSPSPTIEGINPAIFTLSTTWTRYSTTFTMPSIKNMTLGINGDDFYYVSFWFDEGGNANWNIRASNLGQQSGTFYLWGFQLEEGSVASPVESLLPYVDSLKLVSPPQPNMWYNGGLHIRQRGDGPFTTAGYTADGVKLGIAGSTSSVTLAQALSGETTLYDKFRYIRFTNTSVAGVGNLINFALSIEQARWLMGKTLTLSMLARADAARNIFFEATQIFGSGGAPTPQITGIGAKTIPLTTTWQRISHTFTMPLQGAGKSFGTNLDDRTSFEFWMDAGSNFNARTNTLGQQSGTFDFALLKIEEGPIATPYPYTDPMAELAKCQRYFETSYPNGTFPGQASGLGGSATDVNQTAILCTAPNAGIANRQIGHQRFHVQKRAAPTMAYWDILGNSSAFTLVDANGAFNSHNNFTDAFRQVTGSVHGVIANNAPNVAGVYGSMCNWSASAEF